MQFEVIRKSHKKEILIGAVVFILIAIVLIVQLSFAKYQTTKNVTIASGTVNYKVPDFNVIAMYKNDGDGDVEISTMPTSGYIINESKSYCNLNGSKDNNARMYTDINGQHVISKLTKGDRCYLYFDLNKITISKVISSLNVNASTPNFSKTSCAAGTNNGDNCEEVTNGLFKGVEYGEDIYYFRGSVDNNYVKFANLYWRIIRTNSNGSVRLIYQGETPTSVGVISVNNIDVFAFNTVNTDNAYVGFKYTLGVLRGLNYKSNILSNALEPWYTNNLINYADKLDINVGFCGDRTPSSNSNSSDNKGGTGETTTWYGATIRLMSNNTPKLDCPNNGDIYTVKESNTGNKSLTYPIGLITADEVAMAGSKAGNSSVQNYGYYLNTNRAFWTISPAYYNNALGYAGISCMAMSQQGGIIQYIGTTKYYVRPVINLKSDVTVTGKGTASDPYVVQ